MKIKSTNDKGNFTHVFKHIFTRIENSDRTNDVKKFLYCIIREENPLARVSFLFSSIIIILIEFS